MTKDEERLYEIAARELEANAPRKGLYAKAFAESMGDEAKAKALYLRLRVAQLEAELEGERRPAVDSPARCIRALREMGCSVGADATRSWTIVAPDGTATRVFNFDGLQKHTLALRSRADDRGSAADAPPARHKAEPGEPAETEFAQAAAGARPPGDSR